MRIMVVEDEALLAMHLEDLLASLGHESCGAAATGVAALAIAERERPDLALMDLALAGGDDGREVARLLRDLFGVRCVFVTGNPDLLDTAEGRAAAPLGVVGKPFRDEDIAEAIARAEAWAVSVRAVAAG
ncbi:response regulator [Caldovatus aquaticus]|uniref:Response regulator n=1 Tax=Caldovatus aquaticus TaxID=2865671 RepID=A0ABS7F4T6_9PROT|nr:response regulator [Caldovatus aquaticus]MBW8270533.1 response regulator [Caldovatus aquaticus]